MYRRVHLLGRRFAPGSMDHNPDHEGYREMEEKEMINRVERLNDNLTDAYKVLELFISQRRFLNGYAGHIAIFLDDDQLSEIITMLTDYIGYINLDLQEEMVKRYCEHDQNAVMEIAEQMEVDNND